jgi:coenzyme F420-reducing hydrogenase delta subunit
MKALQKGVDGAYVAGCLDGDCHFKNGNVRVARRVAYLKKLLDEIGIGGDRIDMFRMSAGMGERFAQVASEFTEKIRALGPNPVKNAETARLQRTAG